MTDDEGDWPYPDGFGGIAYGPAIWNNPTPVMPWRRWAVQVDHRVLKSNAEQEPIGPPLPMIRAWFPWLFLARWFFNYVIVPMQQNAGVPGVVKLKRDGEFVPVKEREQVELNANADGLVEQTEQFLRGESNP